MKNTGKPSEKAFEAKWKSLGKAAYCHRNPDAAEIFGRVGKVGLTRAMPSDYIIVYNGATEFAEVKSTEDKTAFRFSQLEDKQIGNARMITRAGGQYLIYIHRLLTNEWFRLPFFVVEGRLLADVKSIPWQDLEQYKWDL